MTQASMCPHNNNVTTAWDLISLFLCRKLSSDRKCLCVHDIQLSVLHVNQLNHYPSTHSHPIYYYYYSQFHFLSNHQRWSERSGSGLYGGFDKVWTLNGVKSCRSHMMVVCVIRRKFTLYTVAAIFYEYPTVSHLRPQKVCTNGGSPTAQTTKNTTILYMVCIWLHSTVSTFSKSVSSLRGSMKCRGCSLHENLSMCWSKTNKKKKPLVYKKWNNPINSRMLTEDTKGS